MIRMGKHLCIHPEHATDLAKSVMLTAQALSTYLLIKDYVIIPPGETALLKIYQENRESLRDVLELGPVVKN